MGKSVEDTYQKKSPHEHILTRPDMYIGTIEPITDEIWVYDEADQVMKQRQCTWIPGLYKIFDEIIVNAADNKVRDWEGQTSIKVWIDETSIRVLNNGEGVPVQKHKEHNLWVPEMIFGHLLTSSNYDDSEEKVTGGRNGYGAKLTNVFSTAFEVETVHSRSRKKFHMKWWNNMLSHDEPSITSSDGPDYTMISFTPDFKRFGIERFSEDMLLMMRRRVFDLAGCTDRTLKCYLNGQRIGFSTFPEYVDLYPTMGEERVKQSYARVNDRWEVCVRLSNIGYQQVSFVNSIATTRGGTHVKYILDQVFTKVAEIAKKKSKTEVKAHMIRPHIFLFVNCLISNPSFDSQTKETLNSVRSRFGSTCELPASLLECVLKSGLVERCVEMANSKLTREMASKLQKGDRKQVLGIPKLDDAHEAGGKYGHRCTLILTEGDSAKTLCTAGLAVKDTDFFGVFPLRGKLLNVREAPLKRVMECTEVQHIMKIVGLDVRQKYTSVEGLRYGHVMIMADQDHDGSHIKGLILNLFHHYWPELLRVRGFLQQFITPIVKARRKERGGGGRDTSDQQTISFFSMPEYLHWKGTVGDRIHQYQLRYYKGLGTSGAKEGREYFENIDRHRIEFVSNNDEDRLVMAFARDRVEDRKTWITEFKANEDAVNEGVDYTNPRMTYQSFVDRELILFSVADCERSIPSAIDGFKPGQRKILFSCFKRNLVRSLKVAQLAGYVAEHSAYHHGEQSLVQTIIAMAQNFVGANNLALLEQDGQFGTRLQGGKDHAAGRYIFTRLSSFTRAIFHPSDDFILQYRDDDGQSVEPFYYAPVIPMVLVNGTSGIGTGFSTSIPNYHPMEVMDNLERLMREEEVRPMTPWYLGYQGDMTPQEGSSKFLSHGKLTVRPADGVVCITELPIGVWTQQYKKTLEDLRAKEMVIQFREHNTDVTVDFEVLLHPEVLQAWTQADILEEMLQLREYIHTSNIMCFNHHGQMSKYFSPEALLKEFYGVRLELYAKRKVYLVGQLQRSCRRLQNMVRFVGEVVRGELVVVQKPKRVLLAEIRSRGYDPFPPQPKKNVSNTTIEEDEDGSEDGAGEEAATESSVLSSTAFSDGGAGAVDSPEVIQQSKDYDYLLGMKLWSLTMEMIIRLENQLKAEQEELRLLESKSPQELWRLDLAVLREKIRTTFAKQLAEVAVVKRKKEDKKRPFAANRVRVPLLSDKARQLLRKEVESRTKRSRTGGAAGGRAAITAAGGGSEMELLDAATGGVARSFSSSSSLLQPPRPPVRREVATRKRKRKPSSSSDEDDEDESDWLQSSDDSDDVESVASSGSEGNGRKKAKAKTTATRRPATKGTPTKAATATATTRRRTAAPAPLLNASSVPESIGSSAGPTVLDELSFFGLDAIDSQQATPSAPSAPTTTTTAAPPIPARQLLDDEEDDDLLLLGVKPPPPPPAVAAAPPKKTTVTRQRAPPKPRAAPAAPKKQPPAAKGRSTTAQPKKKRRRRAGSSSSEEESIPSSSSEEEVDSDSDYSD